MSLVRALARFRALLGPEHVLEDEAGLARAGRTTIPDPVPPAAVVRPGSADEVQALVRVAVEEGVPLWPASRGKNWGYGTLTPARSGTVVVLLERMDRILEVDRELAFARLEPGVTYRQLAAHLASHAPELWPDCTDSTPEGSVIGNALERGVGQTPYGDHFGNLCGLEVVTPTGERIRTGGGGFETSRVWNAYKWGLGPYVEGLFSQGNFGIVTQAGTWLMPRPEAFGSYTFGLPREEDFPAMLDAVRGLALQGVIQTRLHMFNAYTGLTVVTQHPHHRPGGARFLDKRGAAALAEEFCMPPWSFMGGLYGSAGEVAARKRALRRSLGRLGRLTFLDDRLADWVPTAKEVLDRMARTPGMRRLARFTTHRLLRRSPEILAAVPHVHGLLKGQPTEFFVRHAYFKSHPEKPDRDVDPARDGCGLMYLAPVAPMRGREVHELLAWLEAEHHEAGFDFYAGLLMVNPRAVVVLLCLAFQKGDPADAARASAFYRFLVEKTLAKGYPRYRGSVAFPEDYYAASPALRGFIERLQAAVDPAGIMAPGKYGIGRGAAGRP